jgi:hypothetical protein
VSALTARHAESVRLELELLKKITRAYLAEYTGLKGYQLEQLINKATTIYNVLRDYEKHVKRMMRF